MIINLNYALRHYMYIVLVWGTVFLLSIKFSFGQGKMLNGKVVDEMGVPLSDVSVLHKRTNIGVKSNSDGEFTVLDYQSSDVLVVSRIGYSTQNVTWDSIDPLIVQLVSANTIIEEVVAIGYGSVKKSDLTGSIASVKGEDINAYPTGNVMQALSGRAAGVQVKTNNGSPGGPVSVRIRGTNSIQGSNEPLYVVDGFPINGTPLMLNNSDIESIEILKDASAVAIYGSRGANGVVLISTKSGKSGKTSIDFESNFGSQMLRKKLDLMNATEYAQFYNLQRINDGLDEFFTSDQINGFGEGFDWQSFVYQKAPIHSTSLTINGGGENTQFSIGASVFGQDGIIKGSNYNRYAIRTNLQHKFSKKLTVNWSSSISRNLANWRNSSGARFGASLISGSLVLPPTLNPYNDDGSYRVISTSYPFLSEGMLNPLNFINEISDKSVVNKVLANGSLSYEIIDGLFLKVLGGVESSDDRGDYYQSLTFFNSQGVASVSTSQFISLLNENTLTYQKSIAGNHNIVALAGITYQDFISKNLSGSGSGFLSDITESYNLGAAAIPGIPGSGYSKSSILSYLGRFDYNFKSKYLMTLSLRADGASKYSEGDKWGIFPSAAIAWKIKEEDFLIDNNTITDFKIRASWGRTGSQAIGAYATLNQLSSGKTVFGDALYNTFSPGTRLPGRLKWETTDQIDLGLDIAFLNNKLRFTIDLYNKKTKDLLNTVQLPSSMGFTSTIQNVGEIENKGLEISLEANVLDEGFIWDLNGNIGFNKTKVVKLYGGKDILGSRIDMLIFADDLTLLREGEELSVFYGYVEDGYTNDGKIKYKDLNNDGSINLQDKTIIGNPNPRFIYGFNSNMSYKGFDLNIFLQGSSGNDLANMSAVGNTLHYGYGNNMLQEVFEDNWTPENTNAKYPKISRSQTLFFSNRFIENGSYLRLKHVEIGYSVPINSGKISWLKKARIYLSGQNLLTLTNYSWWDPEVNSQGGSSSISQGIDYSTYPISKAYNVGVKFGF